jgi:hypothetical protein
VGLGKAGAQPICLEKSDSDACLGLSRTLSSRIVLGTQHKVIDTKNVQGDLGRVGMTENAGVCYVDPVVAGGLGDGAAGF